MCEKEREGETDRQTDRQRDKEGEGENNYEGGTDSVCVCERERFMIQAISHEQQWH